MPEGVGEQRPDRQPERSSARAISRAREGIVGTAASRDQMPVRGDERPATLRENKVSVERKLN